MSGGCWEYVMDYTTGATTTGGLSGITNLYSNFFSNPTYTKYWDKYTSTIRTDFNNRILGDATGEMGPFGNTQDLDGNARPKSSWYKDIAYFAESSDPWFFRGGYWYDGAHAGNLAFSNNTGGADSRIGFRIVLTPQ